MPTNFFYTDIFATLWNLHLSTREKCYAIMARHSGAAMAFQLPAPSRSIDTPENEGHAQCMEIHYDMSTVTPLPVTPWDLAISS